MTVLYRVSQIDFIVPSIRYHCPFNTIWMMNITPNSQGIVFGRKYFDDNLHIQCTHLGIHTNTLYFQGVSISSDNVFVVVVVENDIHTQPKNRWNKSILQFVLSISYLRRHSDTDNKT